MFLRDGQEEGAAISGERIGISRNRLQIEINILEDDPTFKYETLLVWWLERYAKFEFLGSWEEQLIIFGERIRLGGIF